MNNKIRMGAAGLGGIRSSSRFGLCLYLPHRPDMPEYAQLQHIRLLKSGDIAAIINSCGNHWRKIFVIFAKLACAIDSRGLDWKHYMNEHLLQASGQEQLLFVSADFCLDDADARMIHLVSGKACAESFARLPACASISEDFSINGAGNVVITPYFDYRQLSNAKIEYLLGLLNTYLQDL